MRINKHIHPLLVCTIVIIGILIVVIYEQNKGQWECAHTHKEITQNVSSTCDVAYDLQERLDCKVTHCSSDELAPTGRWNNERDCMERWCDFPPGKFIHEHIDLAQAVKDSNYCKISNGNFTLKFMEIEVCDKYTRVRP